MIHFIVFFAIATKIRQKRLLDPILTFFNISQKTAFNAAHYLSLPGNYRFIEASASNASNNLP
jgi:hypothetical protein